MSTRSPTLTALAACVALPGLALALTACGDQTPAAPYAGADAISATPAAAEAAAASTLNRDLAALRRATAPFHRLEAGAAAGYEVLVTHPVSGAACLEHPTLGGMGRHFLNLDLADDEVSVTQPEVLIYEPQPNGRLRLVGVEYLVPFGLRGPEEPAPVLFGREFVPNETFDVWALHVWSWKHNPAGMFADWNPTVGCDFDDRVEG